MYDPFDVADEILVDILMIGRYIEKNADGSIQLSVENEMNLLAIIDIPAKYCSPQCWNQANVYKSRAKNK